MNLTHRISVIMPCFMRPARTARMIECINSQSISNWHAFIVGDNCPYFEELINSGYIDRLAYINELKENRIESFNHQINFGGHGYQIRNEGIQLAQGKYTIFLDNDDFVLPIHFEHYLSEIEGTEFDFVYYNSFIAPSKSLRVTELKEGMIGHSEIIVRTDFLQKISPEEPGYGHDWKLIENMLNAGAKYKKAESKHPTYHIMGLGDLRDDNID